MAVPADFPRKAQSSLLARAKGRNPAKRLARMLVAALTLYLTVHVGLLYAKLDFTSSGLGDSEASDFFVYYSAARMFAETGDAAALYDIQAVKAFQLGLGADPEGKAPFNYPPSYIFVIWPLAALPHAAALICWQLIGLGLFAWSLRVAGLRRAEILAGLVAPASALNFSAGQNGFLTSALLIAGMTLLARKERTAGLLFGLLTLKPHLGLLIPVAALAGRRWRAIAATLLTTAGLTALSMAFFGIGPWLTYPSFLGWFISEVGAHVDGTFLNPSASVFQAAQLAGLPTAAGCAIQAVVALAVGVAVYRAYRRPAAPDLQLALLLVGTSLAMPYGYVYDLPFVAAGIILAARPGLRDGFQPYEGLCLLAAFLLPFAANKFNGADMPLLPVAHLAVFGWILLRLSKSQDGREA